MIRTYLIVLCRRTFRAGELATNYHQFNFRGTLEQAIAAMARRVEENGADEWEGLGVQCGGEWIA